jgi:hypothetical protein
MEKNHKDAIKGYNAKFWRKRTEKIALAKKEQQSDENN